MTAPHVDRRLEDSGAAERDLLHAAATGRMVDLRTGDAPSDDPAHGATWAAERTVRASVLVDLLTGLRTPEGGRLRAVKLRGARITGVLDLEAAELSCPLLLADCRVEEPVDLRGASAPAIRLPGCHLPGLRADQLHTRGDLDLDGIVTDRSVTLGGARIGGGLSLKGARLSDPGGHALRADALTVTESMWCRDGFTADGQIHLRGAKIGGTFDLTRAHLNAPGIEALRAARLTVGDDMFCGDLTVDGEVRLPGARIGGRLDLTRARLTNPGGVALTADRLTVDDGVLAEALTAEGEVRLPGAQVGGTLILARARLTNPGGTALNADGLVVDQDVQATDGFTAEGQTRLVGARVGGLFSFEGGALINPGGWALYAFQLSAGGGLHCRAGFTAEGEILLAGARIDGYFDLTDARLTKPRRRSLNLEGISAIALVLLPRHRPDGDVDLTNAHVGLFEDDAATWPASFRLRGFTYDSLGLRGDEEDVRTRLGWLARDPGGYVPQLYDQLAAAYRRAGDEQAARTVAVAKQWRRRTVRSPAGRLANWLLYLTVGYGYRTWLAALWLAGLLALGTWIFSDAYPRDLVRVDARGPGFSALGYTLDVLLPIVDLGQQKAWQAHGAAMYWSWAFMAAGWVLTTAVVAGLTGILKRD